MKRRGLEVSSQTRWDQVLGLAMALEPAYAAVREHILGHDVIGLDQTSWPRLEEGKSHKLGAKPWQMWALTTPDAAYYAICEDKSAATGLDLLGDFAGTIVRDQARRTAPSRETARSSLRGAGHTSSAASKTPPRTPARPS